MLGVAEHLSARHSTRQAPLGGCTWPSVFAFKSLDEITFTMLYLRTSHLAGTCKFAQDREWVDAVHCSSVESFGLLSTWNYQELCNATSWEEWASCVAKLSCYLKLRSTEKLAQMCHARHCLTALALFDIQTCVAIDHKRALQVDQFDHRLNRFDNIVAICDAINSSECAIV